MALFFSAEAQERPAPAAQTEIENLRAELQLTKDAARLRARHGPHLTDEQVAELLAAEADMVVRKAKAKEAAELNRQNEIKMDKAYRDLACELVKKGSLIISVDGKRLKSITPDLIIPCPHLTCGKPLAELSQKVYDFAKLWYWSTEESGDRNRLNLFMIYSARSPLTECGFPGHVLYTCPSCRSQLRAIVQVVLA